MVCAKPTISCPVTGLSPVRARRPDAEGDRAACESDGSGLRRYVAELETVVDYSRNGCCGRRPSRGQGQRDPEAGDAWAGLGRALAGRTRVVHDFAMRSAAEILDRHFKATWPRHCFGFDGVVGNFASPQAPGTAYVLLHHLFGEAAGVPGAWGHAIGGMGSITQAMARACREAGSISSSTRRSRKSSSMAGGLRGSSPTARPGARPASSRGSIRSCCSTGCCPTARSMTTQPRECTPGSAKARPSG